jgi:S1-C subfamily serine protease
MITKGVQTRPGSPASANKLAVGDVIVAIDGQAVRDNDGLVRAVRSRRPGAAVTLTVQRGESTFDRPIVLHPMPHAVWQAELAAERSARR